MNVNFYINSFQIDCIKKALDFFSINTVTPLNYLRLTLVFKMNAGSCW